MGIFSKLIPVIALAAGVIFLGNALTRPASASLTAGALGDTGAAIGSSLGKIGTGAAGLGEGVGTGLAGLFKPFWEVRNLLNLPSEVESTQVSGSANSSAVAQNEGGNRSSNTITWSSGASARVPTLSSAAKSFYASRGVSVT
jgi:hypothetical protein